MFFFIIRVLGWDEGLLGACVGEKRQLVIPSGKAYGERGVPGFIAPGASLVFNVEVVSIDERDEL
jgi:FKBP-type peptidyl-prolyl cis-trans isomerase